MLKERSVGGITRSESETLSSLDPKLVLGRVLLLCSTGKECLLNMSHSSHNTGQDVQCCDWRAVPRTFREQHGKQAVRGTPHWHPTLYSAYLIPRSLIQCQEGEQEGRKGGGSKLSVFSVQAFTWHTQGLGANTQHCKNNNKR